jgi:hypothetical protein
MKRIYLLLFVAVIIAACDRDFPVYPPSDGPQGSYAYTGYDSTGVALVKGWLTITFADSVCITGDWKFARVAVGQGLGPQIGDGQLVGGRDNNEVWINLNPQMRDNNVLLRGILDETTYQGDWTWVTFAGPTTGGAFTAVKK